MILRPAVSGDLDHILTLEARPEYQAFIGSWTREEHSRGLKDPDKCYFIFETHAGVPLGYAILVGLGNPHASIELTRMALADPGQGKGRLALRLLVRHVFDDLGAHRLWLDVFDDNLRAQRAYRACGFQEDGRLRDVIRQGDKYRTLILMSLLESEYRALATPDP